MNQLDHSYFQQRLSGYVDGELEPSVRAQVEDHLRDCPECRDRVQEIERLGEFVAQKSGLAESDYWEQAAQRIERAVEAAQPKIVDLKAERVHRPASPWWWRAPAIAASVLFLGYLTLHESSILRDEVLTPARSSEVKPTLLTSPADSVAKKEASGSGMTSPDIRDIAPAPAMPEPQQEVVEKPTGDQEVLPAPTTAEKDRRRESGLGGEESVELNKSIITLPEDKTVDRSAGRTSPDPTALAKPEVTIPAETLEKATTENAPFTEKVVSVADEQNYRERDREKGTYILRDTLQLTPDLYSVEKIEEAGLSALQHDELTYWRDRRDSLVQQAALIESQDSSPIGRALRYSLTPAKSDVRTALSADDPRQSVKNQAEAGLLEAWYQVCRLTSDSTEVNKGMSFIERVAADRASNNRESARDYLKQLGRH
jgi:hypothetical protein